VKAGIRTLTVALALLAAILAAPSTAQAAPESAADIATAIQNPDGDGGDRFTAPGTPRITAPPADKATAAASSPTVSPSVGYEYVAAGGTYTCYSGYFCAGVWDPTVSKWKVFKFYYCNRHSVYNWLGNGFYLNNQTGGATAIFYGSNSQILRYAPADGRQYSYNWDPIWSIKNC
jgi:hypothetical protein